MGRSNLKKKVKKKKKPPCIELEFVELEFQNITIGFHNFFLFFFNFQFVITQLSKNRIYIVIRFLENQVSKHGHFPN